MSSCDEECAAKGIPPYLHQCGRPSVEFSDPSERLFRRFKDPGKIGEAISFERKNSSSNRSRYCEGGPDDVLHNTESGERYSGYGVLSFPVSILDGKSFISEEPAEFIIEIAHEPERCNYAHSDFRITKNGEEVTKIKPTRVKLEIREMLEPHIKVEIDPH